MEHFNYDSCWIIKYVIDKIKAKKQTHFAFKKKLDKSIKILIHDTILPSLQRQYDMIKFND